MPATGRQAGTGGLSTTSSRSRSNGDGRASIAELLRGVNISLAAVPLSICPVFDADDSGDVAVNEIVQAVGSALRGCTLAD